MSNSDDLDRVAAAYVFAYPLLLTRRALRDANRLFISPGPPGMLTVSGWLDLAREPWVISVPDSLGRYYVLWLRDAWNTAYASFGPRSTGGQARAFAILGPARHGERLRPEFTPVEAPTAMVRVSGRIEAADAGAFVEGLSVCSASRWHRGARGVAAGPREAAHGADAVAAVESLAAPAYFQEALSLAAENPAQREDRASLDALRALLEQTPVAVLEAGALRGREAIRRAAQDASPAGWRVSRDVGRYGGDHLRRAAAARVQGDAEPVTDELVAVTGHDADGRPLTGAERFELRFPANALPPVGAHWSLATGAGSTGDLDGLTLDPDGSLLIRIQRDRPADGGNWLPAPPEAFSVALCLHWPFEEALRGQWTPPAIERAGQRRRPKLPTSTPITVTR